MADSVRPHRWQPTRLPCPWDSPGKNTGVDCHFLLQCMKVKSESEVAYSCPTLSDPMDCSLPGSSVHGILQARVRSGVPLSSLFHPTGATIIWLMPPSQPNFSSVPFMISPWKSPCLPFIFSDTAKSFPPVWNTPSYKCYPALFIAEPFFKLQFRCRPPAPAKYVKWFYPMWVQVSLFITLSIISLFVE